MPRTWFYSKMAGDSSLMTSLPGGLHQTTKLLRVPDLKPFGMYRAVADNSALRGDDADVAKTETFLVFVHDVEGDYTLIDTILENIRLLFKSIMAAGDPEVISVIWLETSEDYRDDDMGTIFRYSRIQLNYRAA